MLNPRHLRFFAMIVSLALCEALFAQNVIRGPYLQMLDEDGLIVRWRTDLATGSVVRFGADTAQLDQMVSVEGTRTEHSVQLIGLDASTHYFYSIGNQAGTFAGDDSFHFRTAPAAGTAAPTRIWVIGDSGTANSNAWAVRDAFKAWSQSNPANFMIMLGDNAYNNGTDAEYQAAVFESYPELLRQLPVWSTLGNHDGYSADSATQSGPYFDIFDLPAAGEVGGLPSGTEAYYSFDHGNVHFICLDSYETDRSANGNMMQWLEADLASNNKPWVVAFWHHPPYTKGSHDSDSEGRLVDMRQNALPILEAWGVDLVLSGHSHSYERSYLIDGHYGNSLSLDPITQVLDPGDGGVTGDGAYEKPQLIAAEHQGAVYAVAGSSGKVSGGSLDHPAMFVSLNSLGSMVLDVNGNQLDAVFIDEGGSVLDQFTIVKSPDVEPPMISDVWAEDGNHVIVEYSERVEETSAIDVTHYGISGLSISSAALVAGAKSVRLTTSLMSSGSSYMLAVEGVTDEAGIPIAPGSQFEFQFLQQQTLSFQDGLAPEPSYAGTSDSYIREASPTTNYGSALSLQVDGDEPSGAGTDMSILVQWDISMVPESAVVDAVQIHLNTLNVGGPYSCYGLSRSWNENETTWSVADSSNPWATPGANGASDRDAVPLCNFNAGSTGPITIALNSAGLSWVQAWINNPASNHGILIADTVSSNGADFDSSESSTAMNRPKIEVSFTVPANPPPTPNPMTWEQLPALDPAWPDDNVIAMTASSASDADGGVEYYFDCVEAPAGNWYLGCEDSGWQSSRTFSDWYVEAGATVNYRVRARDALGNQTDWSTSAQITVPVSNQPPNAASSYSCLERTCQFEDMSSDSDGSVVAWTWDFGDGASSSVQNPQHTYAEDGSFLVTLMVEDDAGAQDSTSLLATVGDGGAGGLEIISWVPVYAIDQAKAAAEANLGNCDIGDGLSRLGLQFWTPNPDGSIKYANHEFYTPNDADVLYWRDWAGPRNIEVFLTIYNNTGSWDWNLARAAFDTNMSSFVSALIAEMQRLQLDGIDLDLEGIDGEIQAGDRAAFDAFVHALWQQTSALGKGLTINSFPYIWNAPNQDWWSDWVGEVDNIHSMGYQELYEGGTGWQTYSYQQSAGVAAGHAADAVSMGMPSWLASWGVTSGRGTSALAHVQEVRLDLLQPTGVAIWDLQMSAWQDPELWCEIQALKNSGGPSVPAAPSQLQAAAYSNSQINLVWADNSQDEEQFRLERAVTGSGSWALLALVDANVTSYSDTGLAPDTGYDYRVFATNVQGDSQPSGVASAITFALVRKLEFSGRSWTVKSSVNPVGPGPNYFGDTADDVWVDENGHLHLRISFRDGAWRSSEVITDEALGHGTYEFALASRVDQFDANTVVGLFTWDTSAPAFNYREIDIEFSRWGNPTNDNSQYVVQPWDTAGNTYRWNTVLNGNESTHQFTWNPDSVEFSSHQGDSTGALIQSWAYSGADVPPAGTLSGNARINLWLMGGAAPLDGLDTELVITSFQFTPAPENVPPNANFDVACSQLECTFTDQSTDSDGVVGAWSWDFGDGSTSSDQNPTHSYTTSGDYLVSLLITDDDGAQDNQSSNISVTEPPPWVDALALADQFGAGSVSGSYADTHAGADGAIQSITERESGGKKQSRYSYLSHTWVFELPESEIATFHANTWRGAAGEDQFVYLFSEDNAQFTEMFTMDTTDEDAIYSWQLPLGVSGPVYIRVEDTDQTPGNRFRETVYIDQLYIRAETAAINPPAAPGGLTAVAISSERIDLAWSDESENETGFLIERSGDGLVFTEIGSSAADTATYSDQGLQAETPYWYRVRAWNTAGESVPSNVDSVTTLSPPPAPEAPTGLSATAAGVDRINLSWQDNSSSESGFRIERSLGGSSFVEIAQTNADVSVFTDVGLASGTTYHYRVAAFNQSGDSLYTNVDSASTDSTPTIVLNLSGGKNKGKHYIDLSWSGVAGDRIDVYRDSDAPFTVPNNGGYRDQTNNKGSRTYQYRVCEEGTERCSAIETIAL